MTRSLNTNGTTRLAPSSAIAARHPARRSWNSGSSSTRSRVSGWRLSSRHRTSGESAPIAGASVSSS